MAGEIDLRELMDKAGGYSPDAYEFIRDGLAHTVDMIHPDLSSDPDDESHHVTGQQLCLGLKDYAVKRYGLLARAVLSRWGVRRTDDFGRIVFAMVDAGLMRKTDEDRLEDFVGVYDFDEAFAEPEPTVVN